MPGSLDRISFESALSLFNRYGLCQVRTGLFPTGNKQATFSNASQSRSESVIAINPNNPSNMVGASKKFIDPSIYKFRLGVVYTLDRGNHWHESNLPMLPGWDCMTDPTVAFDTFNNAFLVGEPDRFNPNAVGTSGDLTGLGMVVYRSQDGGASWGQPFQLTTDTQDDKQEVVCDNNPYSPHYGNVYVCWSASSPLRFARSTDHGVTWKGKGTDAPGTSLVSLAFAPEMSVSPDGTLHILWHQDGGSTIQYLRSTDGGNSFSAVQTVVTGIFSLRGHLPITDNWPHFDYGKFRVITLASDCVTPTNALIVCWADMREGRSRIYYRRSPDGGLTWDGPADGQKLLPNVSYGDTHCFHPQIAVTGTGVVGCAFYTFSQQFGKYQVQVQLASSWDDGASFGPFITVTDHPWDPTIDAPSVHGDPNVQFIGEYFGLDAGWEDFALLWTDTRTGVQELFSDVVDTQQINCPRIPELVAEIFGGIAEDGGGWIIVGGKIIRVPPRSPVIEILNTLVAVVAVSEEPAEHNRELRLASLRTTVALLQRQIEEITHES